MTILRDDAWPVGILFSRSGLMAIPSSQHIAGATLAIEEVNAAGGVLGKPLEAIDYDTQSDPALYRRLADRLLTEDAVSVIVGCCTSLGRKAVLPAIERRNGLLWYPDLYEGFEFSPNVIYTGAATNQNSIPLARHLFRRGAQRFVLVGSDYVYPREANRVMRDLIERQGGEILDEIYLPMGAPPDALDRIVRRIATLRPDSVRMGTPIHSASLAVGPALYGKVSSTRSASWKRARYSAGATRGAKTSRSRATPAPSAARRMFSCAVSLSASSHSTLPGTACRMRIHAPKTSGVNLKLLLNEQKTKASSGSP